MCGIQVPLSPLSNKPQQQMVTISQLPTLNNLPNKYHVLLIIMRLLLLLLVNNTKSTESNPISRGLYEVC